MPKTLVTGGNGFIGSAVTRLLAERGDELRLTVRRRSRLENLDGLEYERFECDVLDRQAVRRALRGVDRVFHLAGVVSLRPTDRERLLKVNVEGTRTVLEECLRAGVERVVYTSSAAAVGPAPPGGVADERQVFTAGHLGIPYVNSKHEAEVEAFHIAARGLPLVCVNPCYVLGTGDIYAHATALVRRYLLGRIPAYAPGAINIVDVADVARGHLLADVRGTPGERYILGNRNYTLDRLFADLARITGFEPPALRLPPDIAMLAARGLGAVSGGHGPVNVRRGQAGELLVDVPQQQGEARARLAHLASRGHDRSDRALVPRARGRADPPCPALPAAAVQGRRGGSRRAGGGDPRRAPPVAARQRLSTPGS